MKIFSKKDTIHKNNFLHNDELIANKYALKSGTTAMIIITIIWLLNVANIFVVDKAIMSNCYTSCVIIYVIGIVICSIVDMSKSWVKYFLLLWIIAFMTVLSVFLTFHAVITCLLPIVYTTMYSSKKMMVYTYILTVFSILMGVYGGSYLGVVDENIVGFSADKMALYFVFPRCMICIAFTVVCANIAKIINMNVKYAQKMENLAEVDGMTGLYNKSKYLDVVSNTHLSEEKLAVIFWDINNLKKINDTIGHEAGDTLILTVSESIRNVCSASENAYRIGGDEFIMILRDGDEKQLTKKLQEWDVALSRLKKNIEFDVSVSVGYAYGEGKDLESLIHEADQMMYENKRLFHESEKNNIII